MANLLWGKIYYKDQFAGYIREEPGDRITFQYDQSYLNSGSPAIAHTLPLQEEKHTSENGLHSFFDNLVSEGWLEQAQTRLLGRRHVSRFELLLTFGFDCAGAVSVIDPEPSELSRVMLDMDDAKELATLTSRASLSGVQPKLAIREEGGKFYPTQINELSTHIAKFPSSGHSDLIINEYLTTQALKSLIPDDEVVDLHIGSIEGLDELALIIKRFDRREGERIHFEEFNQILGLKSKNKYDGSHKDMSDFIHSSKRCIPSQAYILYRRLMAGFLLGNTDMHFKNFALFSNEVGYRLTPSYDQVAASLYHYKTIALEINGAKDLNIGSLKARNLIALGEEFNQSRAAMNLVVRQLSENLDKAKGVISESPYGDNLIKNKITNLMDKRWNGTYALIGHHLLKKQ